MSNTDDAATTAAVVVVVFMQPKYRKLQLSILSVGSASISIFPRYTFRSNSYFCVRYFVVAFIFLILVSAKRFRFSSEQLSIFVTYLVIDVFYVNTSAYENTNTHIHSHVNRVNRVPCMRDTFRICIYSVGRTYIPGVCINAKWVFIASNCCSPFTR